MQFYHVNFWVDFEDFYGKSDSYAHDIFNSVFRELNDLFINIEYNCLPAIKGKGSAIFLHSTNKKYKPTKGCVAILKKDFLKILLLINNKTKISIN